MWSLTLVFNFNFANTITKQKFTHDETKIVSFSLQPLMFKIESKIIVNTFQGVLLLNIENEPVTR